MPAAGDRGRQNGRETADRFVRQTKRYMEREHMAAQGERVLVAVSGGVDSVCLLRVLYALSEEMRMELAAVHVNHRLRNRASEDEAYVRGLCEELKLPCFVYSEPVGDWAGKWGCSLEEAGRRVRYHSYEEAAGTFGAARIAVAHNQNDCAETLLFRLFRGTGLDGMAGIRPVRALCDGQEPTGGRTLIRPLLWAGRDEIEAWMRARGYAWRTDESNETDDYARNRIRHHILPYARQELCEGAVVHLAWEAGQLSEAADYVNRQAQAALTRCVTWEDGAAISCEAFLKEDRYLQGQMLKLLLTRLTDSGRDISRCHVDALLALCEAQSGRRVSLPYGVSAERVFGTVYVHTATQRVADGSASPVEPSGYDGAAGERQERSASPGTGTTGIDLKPRLDAAGRMCLYEEGLGWLEFELLKGEDVPAPGEIPHKKDAKWLDYDTIRSLTIRTRRQGDYLGINDALQTTSLKKYMIGEKIPAPERSDRKLLADGSHVLWLPGYRISSLVKVTERTERVLVVRLSGAKEPYRGGARNERNSQGDAVRGRGGCQDLGNGREDQQGL